MSSVLSNVQQSFLLDLVSCIIGGKKAKKVHVQYACFTNILFKRRIITIIYVTYLLKDKHNTGSTLMTLSANSVFTCRIHVLQYC